MPQADIVNVERLGDHHVIGATGCDIASLDEQSHAGIAIACALFIDDPALLNGALHLQASAANGLNGIDLCCDATFHVGCSASEDAPVAHLASEGIAGPAWAHWHHVHVPIKVHDG